MHMPPAILLRLGSLRWLNMVAYSAIYVVIPALVFRETRSAWVAGIAFVIEGLIRTVLSLWSAKLYARLGSGRAILVAEVCRACAITMLFVALDDFSLVLVVAASVLFQFGFGVVVLEQELRCTELGPTAVRGQATYRFAEVAAMPAVVALVVAVHEPLTQMQILLTVSAIAVVAHLVCAKAWYPKDYANSSMLSNLRLVESARNIVRDPLLWQGLAVCVIAFTVFVWTLSGGPFLFEGRSVLGFGMDTPSGIAVFKTVLAIAGGAGALLSARILTRPYGARAAIVGSVAAPGLLGLSAAAPADWLALLLISLMTAGVMGTLSWQRAYRQASAPPHLRTGMTTLFLSADCVGMVLAGVALIVGKPLLTGVAMCAICMLLSVGAWRSNAVSASTGTAGANSGRGAGVS